MKFIYDHLSASILGFSVFFILIAVQLQGGETSRDQTRYYSSKTHLLNVKEMIEHDFENIGAGVARVDPIFISKTDSTIEFMEKLNPADDEPARITYRRVPTRPVTIDDEEVQLYEIQRLVNDVLTGKSTDTMRIFEVALRNAAGQPAASFNEVAAVYVRFVIAPPLGGDDGLHEARWNRTFWPSNLTNF